MSENKNKGFFAGLLDRFRKPGKEEPPSPPLAAVKEETGKPPEKKPEKEVIQPESVPSAPQAAVVTKAEDKTKPEIPEPDKAENSKGTVEEKIAESEPTGEMPVPSPKSAELAPPLMTSDAPVFEAADEPLPPTEVAKVAEEVIIPDDAKTLNGNENPPEKKSFLDIFRQAKGKEEKEASVPLEDEKKPVSWFQRLKEGLDKTRRSFVFKVKGLLKLRHVIDEDFWEELEDILITADVGLKTNEFIIGEMKKEVEEKLISEPSRLFEVMKEKLCAILEEKPPALSLKESGLTVIMVVGVNGTGKTTSIAKLANRLMMEDKKVIVAAADTFRAAAIEQLEVWSRRTGLELIKHQEGADPAAVVFDALQAASARGADVLIIDTAGRLHSKVNLMKELEKIKRVIGKIVPEGPAETLLVLDATTGQNALIQAKTFSETVDVSGIVLTKLDGTAKGGVIIGIVHELGIPVKFIGIGEGVLDLRPFEGKNFLDALFSDDGENGDKTA